MSPTLRRRNLFLYDTPPQHQSGDYYVISWDTAMKATEIADYSVGTVWHVRGDTCYLIDLIRDRYDFPDLKRAVIRQKAQWPSAFVLIEDKASGTSLIQELRNNNIEVIPIVSKDDKVTQLFATQPRFEGGAVHFPATAPWFDDLIAELLAFPQGRHDDQVDSIAQALAWIDRRNRDWDNFACFTPPIFVTIRNPDREAFPDYLTIPR